MHWHRSRPRSALTLLALGAVLAPRAAFPQEQAFLDWTTTPFPRQEYLSRQARALDALAVTGGVLLAISGDGLSRGETFRALDDFMYFVGVELPNATMMLDGSDGTVTVFLPARDARFENPARPNDFPGRPLLDDPALLAAIPATVRHERDLLPTLRQHAGADRPLAVNWGRRRPLEAIGTGVNTTPSLEESFARFLRETLPDARIVNGFDLMAGLRSVKSPREVEAIRRAVRATEAGIRRAARLIRDGIDERALAGELEAGFKAAGAPRVAFDPIVKSGENALWPWRVLASHYERRNRAMRDGEVVVFDVGAEVQGYVADVGRTFPVSGRFTDRQRHILAMEVSVADAIIAAIRPGVTFGDLMAVAHSAIPAEHRPYMQTGSFFGHHIGLSTGDPSHIAEPLRPGMVFTVEPWYYNHDTGIAVFTEDIVVVTDSGAEILSDGIPRAPGALEQMVGR